MRAASYWVPLSPFPKVFTSNVTQETQDAADIVLVIDDSGSMNREHEWLLIMVPLLEQILISAGKLISQFRISCTMQYMCTSM